MAFFLILGPLACAGPPQASPSAEAPAAAPVAAPAPRRAPRVVTPMGEKPAEQLRSTVSPAGVIAAGPRVDAALVSRTHAEHPVKGGICPAGMVPILNAAAPVYCIDAYEERASGEPGRVDQGAGWPDGSTLAVPLSEAGAEPTVGFSWYQAASACRNAGKHLCTVAEWEDACDGRLGPGGRDFPWGGYPDPAARCFTQATSGEARVHRAQPSGSAPDCRNEAGVFDQIGNVWEWADPGVVRPDGTPVTAKLGGAYYSGRSPGLPKGAPDAARCDAELALEHPPTFNGSIGFRCCQAPSRP